ncbi:GNAT family N-acetyltransferase [Flavobacterium sp. F-65]|uniref:GNAT family N-acetyltransferase n=1 Tax=Flavobacterium pisciphilum TaxID=2893755 RepID=A0ABS8MMQ7_9FLAO|nr:GNAT family N-acetyltransferase [Flavobacterium sp. F-65]MCC9070027.1 GNAT family N-acetyltransferase [Flavobacterium sp. F-65]
MKTENIKIKDKNYTLYKQYQQHEKLRLEFNRMTQDFWDFDFENYYQSGFWDENCIIYSLFDGDKIVSHITVSLFIKEEKTVMQLGTVMTDKDYQKQGLNRFLMERITADFKDKIEGAFLFANDTVLEYYPKFGLVPVSEFEHFQTKKNTALIQKHTKRKLDLENKKDFNLFETLVENSVANSQFQTKSKGLSFFYCYSYPEMGFKDAIYYIEELNCAVVVQVEEQALHIVEIFSQNEIKLDAVISTFADFIFDEVVLGFTPKQTIGFQYRDYKEEDLQLFVSSELQSGFEKNQLRINSLSHT